MLKRNNEYFENMLKIGEAYEAKKTALEEKKQEIIDTCGWDSEELKAWYEEKENSSTRFRRVPVSGRWS